MSQSRLNIVIGLVMLLQFICAMYSPVASSQSVRLMSNFNGQKSGQGDHSVIKLDEPLPLPIILTMPGEYKSNRPLFQKYSLRKYQLYDTNYLPDLSQISRLDQQLAYNMQPPTGVFEQSSKIVIENYRLLQLKEFKITLINPSQRYRFCVQEIFIDSEEITRQQKRPLPFCLNSTTKYPFFFSLYITEHKPLIFKGTVYFIITIYDGAELVDEKIWPKQIIVKVTHNHLRLIPLEIRNCNKDNSIVMIRNPQKWDLSLVIIYKRKLYQLTGQPIDGNIIIPSQKSYKFIIDGKDSKMTIYTKSVVTDITYPVLYVPIYCIQDLIIDYFNIGILSDDRSLLEFPVTVSSYSNSTIEIQQILLKSSSQTVELLDLRERYNYYYEIEPNVRHFIIARIVIHSSKSNVQAQRSYFDVTVKYRLKGDNNSAEKKENNLLESEQNIQQRDYDLRETKTTFHYCEMRSPISVGGKRFIDISKLNDGTVTTSVSQNAFPIRNNLNLPINLIRVIYDESKFKLLWLQDRRDYIFPNHQRDEFSLQYIGPRNLPLSPMKYVALLQFNGNLFIPLEIVVYDKTLQCIYDDEENKPIKCVDLPAIEFGYFDQQPPQNQLQTSQNKKSSKQTKQKDSANNIQIYEPQTKNKRIVIRNWNPEAKNIKIGIQQNSIQKYGFNTTVKIIGPFPEYDVHIRTTGNIHEFYLKGNHYVIVEIKMYPLINATSGTLPLRILTLQEHITKPIKFKVQNGTIALIPQISRFPSFYKKSIEYLNLVSTYREPYRIKSITSNLSNLIVYSNNYTEIYENQWIGMALIYQPFLGQWNITQECCSEKKGVERLFKDLKVGGNRPTPVEIRLKTSTELQTMALVLIDRSSPPLIQLPYNHQFSIREKFRKDAQRIDIHLIDDGNMQRFEYKLKVKNIFESFLKGNVLLFDEDLIQRLDEYSEYRKRMGDIVTAYFCLRNDVKVKHNFNPTLIKTLFQLPQLPIEITVQPLTNTSFYINSPLPPRQEVIESIKFSQYFRETINSGSRMCYRFQTSLFIRNLIQTGVINWFSQQFRFELLSQFMKREFQQIQPSHLINAQGSSSLLHSLNNHKQAHHTKFHLTYDEFYADHYIDREHFCKADRNKDKMTSMFKFCQHINIKMHYLNTQNDIEMRKKQLERNNDTLNGTIGSSTEGRKDSLKDSKKQSKEQMRRLKRLTQKQANKCFILPPADKKSPTQGQQDQQIVPKIPVLKKNQLQVGFEIFPVRHRAPIFTFGSKKYRSTIENPHLPKDGSKVKETQPEIKKTIPSTTVVEENQQPLFLTTPSFYLVLLNNYTSYQLYHQTIQISKPKLRIKNVIINGQVIDKNEYQRNYFLDQLTYADKKLQEKQDFKGLSTLPKQFSSRVRKNNCQMQRSRWLPIYIDEKDMKIKLINTQSSIKNTQPENPINIESQNIEATIMSSQHEKSTIEEMLKNGQLQKIYLEGQRVFEIINEGQADITYTHIGIENVERTCSYKGIQMIVGPCTENWTIESINQTLQADKILRQEDSPNNQSHLPVFKLFPKLPQKIRIRYSIPLTELMKPFKNQQKASKSVNEHKQSSISMSVYLYNQNSYYMQFVLKFKLSTEIQSMLMNVASKNEGENESGGFFLSKVWNIPLNIMAVVFICATILKFREDEENAKRILSHRSNIDLAAAVSFSSPNKLPQHNYQKAYKRMRLKNELMNQQMGSRQFNQPSYQIIQSSIYPYLIGTPFSQKSTTQYHPIVTVSQQLLNAIKQQQKKEKILHNYFNESQQSEIMAKHQHEINENISLTINLDDVDDNKSNRHNESVSQESSFEFDLRNTSHSQDQHLRKDTQSHYESGSNSDFSQASQSQLPDGEQVEVTDEILNESDEVFGFASESKKKSLNTSQTNQDEEDKKQGYYNVFFTDNPLKKSKQSQNNSPFSWMNENKKRSRLKW